MNNVFILVRVWSGILIEIYYPAYFISGLIEVAFFLVMNISRKNRMINSTTSKKDTNEIPRYKASAPPNEFRNSAQLISGDSTIFSVLIVAKYTLTWNELTYKDYWYLSVRVKSPISVLLRYIYSTLHLTYLQVIIWNMILCGDYKRFMPGCNMERLCLCNC